MSKVNGELRTCDRCGQTVFLRCTGEGEADGGWTRWNKFEKAPLGWNYLPGIGDLCPKCWEEYSTMLNAFKTQLRDNGFEED